MPLRPGCSPPGYALGGQGGSLGGGSLGNRPPVRDGKAMPPPRLSAPQRVGAPGAGAKPTAHSA